MAILFFVNTTGVAEGVILELRGALNDVECNRSRRFVRVEDRNSYIAAHALKRVVLASLLNQDVNDLMFSIDALGKPFLLNSTICFNLSHTVGMVAFAFSEQGEVGVDVEHCSHGIYDHQIAKMVLSDIEFDAMEKSADTKSSFLKLWTMKESVAKAVGGGLSMDFRHINENDHKVKIESTVWHIQHYCPSNMYISTLAYLHGDVVYHTLNLKGFNELQLEIQRILSAKKAES